MIKIDYKLVLIIFLVMFPMVSAQQQQVSRDDALFIIEKVNQQNEITIQREVQKSTDILGKNMDENYRVLDERMHSMYNDVVRKLILGFIGGFSVILVGYAWLLSYTTRKYTPMYQRNLLKNKYGKMIKDGRMIVDDPYLRELGIVQDGKDKVTKDAKVNVEPPSMEMPGVPNGRESSYNYDFNAFEYDIYPRSASANVSSGKASGNKFTFFGTFKDLFSYLKIVAIILVVVAIVSVVLLYFKINVFRYVGIELPAALFKG